MVDDIPDEGDKEESLKVAQAKERYAAFLEKNPAAEILSFEHDGSENLFIAHPWNDRSVAITLPDDDDALSDSLNNLFLPPRYTALYHCDLRLLEVIWTAYKLDGDQQELVGRKFKLQLPSVTHECEFRASSGQLYT